MAASTVLRRASCLCRFSSQKKDLCSLKLRASFSSTTSQKSHTSSLLGQSHHYRVNERRVRPFNYAPRSHFSVYSCNRSSTTTSESISSYIPDPPEASYIPTPPEAPLLVEPTEVVTEGLNALGEVSLSSMGLATYTPSGLVRQGLELLHVGLDIPWWGAIAIGACMVRLILFPLIVKSQKNAAIMQRHMPTVQRLNDRVKAAQNRKDYIEMGRLSHELMDYTKRNKFNPLASLFPVMVQVPVFMSVFPALRSMCNYPVESFQTGGMLWFQDLVVTDPYYALPVITAVTMLLIIEMGADGMKSSDLAQRAPNMMYFIRALPIGIFFLTMNFPAGMTMYWCMMNFFSLLQNGVLRIPMVKERLGIPERVVHPEMKKTTPASGQGFFKDMKSSYKSMKVANTIEDRSRINAARYKSAGIAPIQKTFGTAPTKESEEKEKKSSDKVY